MVDAAAVDANAESLLLKVREALRRSSAQEPVSGTELRAALRGCYGSVTAGHRALTAAWGAPLSLFGHAAEAEAARRGVSSQTLSTLREARQLVDEASCLGDRADGYEAQIAIAHRQGRGVRADALLSHLDECEALAGRLRAQLPRLREARASFQQPASPDSGCALGAAADLPMHSRSPEALLSGTTAAFAALPEVILEPTKQEGLVPPLLRSFWQGLRQRSNEMMPRALELAVDAVGYAVAATGRAPGLAKASVHSSWKETSGQPAAWLDLVEDAATAARRREQLVRLSCELVDFGSAKSRWERCRRRTDRRWTLP